MKYECGMIAMLKHGIGFNGKLVELAK